MGIVGGFDVHRGQITVDCIDTESGEVRRGQNRPATRERLREWLERSFAGRSDVATSAPPGSSACTPCCSTRAAPPPGTC